MTSSASVLPPLPAVPMVSVLSLAYNHEEFVAESVESVLAQGWPEDRLQYVVINDASTDGTARALDPYRERVRVVDHVENQGLRRSLDEAMSYMTGDVICGCAGDDAMKPGRIATLVRALQENPSAGLAYSDMEVVDRRGRVIAPSFIEATGLPRRDGRARGELLARNIVAGGSCMLRGCLKPRFHPQPDHVAWEDYWWAWAIAGVADFVHVPEPLYRYRFHGANMSLGVAGAELDERVVAELPFRRFLLRDVRRDDAGPAELLAGIASLWRLIHHVGDAAVAAVAPTDDDRRDGRTWLRRALDALDAGDAHGAALACCRAAAAHPLDPGLLTVVRDVGRHGAGRPPAERAALDELGARTVATIVDADELIARPELLRAYAATFDAADDATLVIHAAPARLEQLSGAIQELVAACGLADDGPDMVLASEPDAQRRQRLFDAGHGSLGSTAFGADVTAFGPADMASLRLIADRRASRRPATCRPLGT